MLGVWPQILHLTGFRKPSRLGSPPKTRPGFIDHRLIPRPDSGQSQMSNNKSVIVCGRSASLRGKLSIGLVLLMLTSYGLPATAAPDSDSSTPRSKEISRQSKPFDADDRHSVINQECASLAPVRWSPHSNLNLSYARGDFTESERSALHQAVTLWQKALALTQAGIVLNEIGEVERDAQPARFQLVVKRDNSMDTGHAGRIMATAGRDNYLQQGFILINGAIHKRDKLKKTMLHELGHGFGLRDCPNCRSGATVMNYFFQQSLMGIKIGRGSGRIANHPTGCDISQVASGYLQSPLPRASKAAEESFESNTVIADETVVLPETKNHEGDDNIVAPYLKPTAPIGLVAPHLTATWIRASPSFVTSAFASGAAETRPDLFGFAGYFQPPWKQGARTSSLTSVLNVAATNDSGAWPVTLVSKPLFAAAKDINANASLSSQPTTDAATPAIVALRGFDKARASVPLAAGSSARSESALSTFEKTAFESYVPTMLETEADTIKELSNYTFRRDVLIQTIDNKGRVSGGYHRVSNLLFDDSGGRIERGVSQSKSTLRGLKISPEYLEDFSGAQLKGFELANRDHYRIEPFMVDDVAGTSMRVYRITPLNLNAERNTRARVFYGFAWVDEKTGKIFKIKGCALPDDKQRFPLFETQRELIDDVHLFPVRTIADDYLVFPSHTIHVRMLITYTNYKKFASRVSVIEVDSGR